MTYNISYDEHVHITITDQSNVHWINMGPKSTGAELLCQERRSKWLTAIFISHNTMDMISALWKEFCISLSVLLTLTVVFSLILLCNLWPIMKKGNMGEVKLPILLSVDLLNYLIQFASCLSLLLNLGFQHCSFWKRCKYLIFRRIFLINTWSCVLFRLTLSLPPNRRVLCLCDLADAYFTLIKQWQEQNKAWDSIKENLIICNRFYQ